MKLISGVPVTLLDLCDRQQYNDFHSVEPLPGWKESTPDDLRRSVGNRPPNVLYLSPPCTGFSGRLFWRISGAAPKHLPDPER